MNISETPKINFKQTNQTVKILNEFLQNKNKRVITVNYKNKDMLLLFLKDVLSNNNLIEGIDFNYFEVKTKQEFEQLSKELLNSEDSELNFQSLLHLLKFYTENKDKQKTSNFIYFIEEENFDSKIVQLLKRIDNTNIQIVYISKNIIDYDVNISSAFDLNEEKDIRTFIEKNCNIDKKKLIRLLTNFIYNDIEVSDKKIDTINKYQILFNDIETILLENITKKDSKFFKNKQKEIEERDNLFNTINLSDVSIGDFDGKDFDVEAQEEKNSMLKILIFGGLFFVSIIAGSIYYFLN